MYVIQIILSYSVGLDCTGFSLWHVKI